ncbi:MAG: alpha/beta hydrolase [Deltaproteobacteria bacterium HGW-Deltaproteobacteria-19]|jgi:pimeloyl-ACP methyl ester carboxylesterase|nr:MAG: alpha/beta hydrolase [Deltaproteobacteria bacterium HGW-Deltaproteobacteria-19]
MGGILFMINGMYVGPWIWENYRDWFEARGWRCITPTLRYHDADPGAPPDPRLGMTSLLDFVQDLEDEIARLEEKPVIMGHSMGGLLAQILGSRGLARALVLVASAAPAGIWVTSPSVTRSFLAQMLQWRFWEKPVLMSYGDSRYGALNLLPEETARRIYGRYVHDSGRALFEMGLWSLDGKRASRVNAANITVPVLALVGEQDRMTPVPVVEKIAGKYRSVSTLKIFPDHAHSLLSEPGWEEIAGHIYDWLVHSGAGPS